MAKVSFSLVKNRFIAISFYHKFGRFRTLTGQTIDPKFWNKRTGRARGDSNFPQYLQLNHLLDTYELRIQDFYRTCLIKGLAPNREDFKKAMNGKLMDPELNPLLVDFIRSTIGTRSRDSQFANNTIKKYKNTASLLIEFTSIRKIRPRLSDVSLEFMNNLKTFLLNVKKHSVNSAAKYLDVVKALLNDALKHDMEVNTKFKLFEISEVPVQKVYLTMAELKTLQDFNFDHRPGLRNAVDLFLIGAFTGLRYSDFSKLKLENIETISGHEIIRIRQIKTGGVVLIPVHPVVREVIQRNNGVPRMISGQKLNDFIKEACQLAGITQNSILYFNQAGVNRSKVVSKYELITTHTARRSFATNAVKAGIPAMDIMRITGHKTEASFRRYICIDDEESALAMAGSRFFN